LITPEQLAILEEKLDPEEIKFVSKGRGSMAYASHPMCVQRLNKAFDGNWSYEVVREHIENNEVAVLCRVTVDGAVKESWGSSARRKDIGDALKSAQSYALRKASSLFGIGLELWIDPPTEPEVKREVAEKKRTRSQDVPGPDQTGHNLKGHVAEAWHTAQRAGIGWPKFCAVVKKDFGHDDPRKLNATQAKELVDRALDVLNRKGENKR